MRVADVLRELGRPIAYYPFLARYLGGVNAAVLFCQIFYWQDKATNELGVHKTSAELEGETGLSYEEQRSARAATPRQGVRHASAAQQRGYMPVTWRPRNKKGLQAKACNPLISLVGAKGFEPSTL
ncbi:hypothetical protein G3N58_16225 [Paraburkholderia sp. Ac-20342]|uniref:hypothetical protein n=1 Tax=Paraburkholderia sp. Ac-20342 TaxID=2703889 RepID=UPI0019800DCE|nr:hypothetical protein [Paraburkholderia sp. Ac-20342]MBN3848365.1 hypothetical protein [Paraburkholderia sp. Ac-20342]